MRYIAAIGCLWLATIALVLGVAAAPLKTADDLTTPAIDLIFVEPPSTTEWLFGQTWIRIQTNNGLDVVYDMGSISPKSSSWMHILKGRTYVKFHSVSFDDLRKTTNEHGYTLYGRRLALPPTIASILVTKLNLQLRQPSPKYAMDPVLNNRLLQCANILDEALNHALSRQASLPLSGTRRSWILEELRPYPIVWGLADVLVRPLDDQPLTAWDAAFLPNGFKRMIDRASLDGRPLVSSDYREGANQFPRPSPTSTNTPLWWIAIPIAILSRSLPRLGTLLGGSLIGGLGIVVLLFQFGPSWYGIADTWYIILLPPAHIILSCMALSPSLWQRSFIFRISYITISTIATTILFSLSLVGWVSPVSISGMLVSLSINLGILLGYHREFRTYRQHPGGPPQSYPRRAISMVERRANYIHPKNTRPR
ncbi:MAG: hypothetical protein KTR25_08685 [Myxococcales bacterium]|nr:hypothetical protein [Myxococcales bacterium]